MSDNEPTTEAAKGSVTYTTLILAVVITAIVSAGSVLAVVYLPGNGDLLEQEGMFDSFPRSRGSSLFFLPVFISSECHADTHIQSHRDCPYTACGSHTNGVQVEGRQTR